MDRGATLGASIELPRFVVDGALGCSVQVAAGGVEDLHEGLVRGRAIGAWHPGAGLRRHPR